MFCRSLQCPEEIPILETEGSLGFIPAEASAEKSPLPCSDQ